MEDNEPTPLAICLYTYIEPYEMERDTYWERRTEIPMAEYWLRKADEFAEAFVASTRTLEVSPDLEALAPPDFWQEWREQYELSLARKLHGQSLIDSTEGLIRDMKGGMSKEKLKKAYRHFMQLAQKAALEAATEGLSKPPSGDTPMLRLVWEALSIHLARQFSGFLLEECATRMLRLWGLFMQTAPSPRCTAYLQRASRCYIWGFTPEAVIMCRSALEAAFDAEISTDDCIDVLGEGERRRDRETSKPLYDLFDRMQVARSKRRIDSGTFDKAEHVRRAGNNVAHRKPSADDSYTVIQETTEVIQALSAGNT